MGKQPFSFSDKHRLLFLLMLVVAINICNAQDMIYLEKSERSGKVIEITADRVNFKNPAIPGPVYSMSRTKVKLLFNQVGGFIVMSKLDSVEPKEAQSLISNFLNPQTNKVPAKWDKILDNKKKILYCIIIKEDTASFIVNLNEVEVPYAKSAISTIIYKDGRHKIIGNVNEASDILKNLSTDIAKEPDMIKIVNNQNKQQNGELSASAITAEADISKKLIAEQKRAKADSLVQVQTQNKKYRQALLEADSYIKKEEFENARTSYILAASIKPEEIGLKEKIDSITTKISLLNQIDSLTIIADNVLATDLYAALSTYKNILSLKPGHYYSSKQIVYLQNLIKTREEEEEVRKKEELEQRFRSSLKSADSLVTVALGKSDTNLQIKIYEAALKKYNEGLSIHPEKEYPREKANTIAFQIDKLKEAIKK